MSKDYNVMTDAWKLFEILSEISKNDTNQNVKCITFSGSVYIDGLVQGRRNSIANTLEVRLSWSNPSIYDTKNIR